MKHPFEPYIAKNSKNMIIGTLPPENIEFYYSNSWNTRMWDILKSIAENTEEIPKGSYKLPIEDKKEILEKLHLSMADIIKKYERKKDKNGNPTTKDKDIIPLEYNDITSIIKNTEIENLIFVYQNALQWFLHSLENSTPIKLNQLPKLKNTEYGIYDTISLNGKTINLILLPIPLNTAGGKTGENIPFKRDKYKEWITK
jgi:G:T/U-mismatch repair DNA glycosylase